MEIDSFWGYKDFKKDVLFVFGDLIKNYNLKIMPEEGDKSFYSITLISKFVHIDIGIDRQGLECSFIEPNLDREFRLVDIDLFNGTYYSLEFEGQIKRVLNYDGEERGKWLYDLDLETMEIRLRYKYKSILKGDFSWIPKYDEWKNWLNNKWCVENPDSDETPSYYEYLSKSP